MHRRERAGKVIARARQERTFLVTTEREGDSNLPIHAFHGIRRVVALAVGHKREAARVALAILRQEDVGECAHLLELVPEGLLGGLEGTR